MADALEAACRTLGVSKDADEAVVTSAYRALAAQYHPDKNPSDTYAEQKFHEITNAYHAWAAAKGVKPGAPAEFADLGDVFQAFGNLFGDFFGTKRAGHGTD